MNINAIVKIKRAVQISFLIRKFVFGQLFFKSFHSFGSFGLSIAISGFEVVEKNSNQ